MDRDVPSQSVAMKSPTPAGFHQQDAQSLKDWFQYELDQLRSTRETMTMEFREREEVFHQHLNDLNVRISMVESSLHAYEEQMPAAEAVPPRTPYVGN